ncbi:hypothetical protein [Micrococcus sp. KRD077]|uniref:hypothetical protein n=1 Tax=Micrococcus sp. KRD077 TaxID=2729720 RepID=UPI0019D13DAB|nr:hypothetical protein [Micrococcus sp. KRD077]
MTAAPMDRTRLERRVTTPILTRAQVVALTHAPEADVRRWTTGPNPAVQRAPRSGWTPFTVNFAGLLEADLLHMLTDMPHLGPRKASGVMRAIRQDHGPLALIEHPGLFTDGKDVFLLDAGVFTRVRDSQGAFAEVLERYTRRLVVRDGRVQEYRPDRLPIASVNPAFNGGGLSLMSNRTPVSAVAGMLLAGETPQSVALDYDLDVSEVQAVERDLEWAWQASAA